MGKRCDKTCKGQGGQETVAGMTGEHQINPEQQVVTVSLIQKHLMISRMSILPIK